MIEKVVSLEIPPGIFHNGTRLQARNRWYHSSLVRWIEKNVIAPIGGWLQVAGVDLLGVPRGIHSWRGNDKSAWLGVGTTGSGTTKAYAIESAVVTDITPAGIVDGAENGSNQSVYGSGNYGAGLYGLGAGAPTLLDADVWHFDNFGQNLLGVLTSDGKLYYWDKNVSNDFVQASGSPTGLIGVVVTPERFIFALGAGGDGRTVRWPIQEGGLTVAGDWTITGSNTAGDFPLATRGRIVAGRRGRRNTLIWTDVDLHAATFIGLPFVYSFEQVGDNCGLLGANAVVMVEGVAYWMSHERFFVYDGAVRALECEVADYVFGSFNRTQRTKVAAVSNTAFDEVTWYYPSAGASENDRYVTYNYRYGLWYYGNLERAVGVDRGVQRYPVLFDRQGQMFEHEKGEERSLSILIEFPSGNRVVNYAVPFLETGPMEIMESEQLARVQKLLPDENTLGAVQATFFVADAPTQTEASFGPFAAAQPTDVRFTARQVRARFAEATAGQGTGWRVGIMRLGVIPAGRR